MAAELQRFTETWGLGEMVSYVDAPGVYTLDSSPEAVERARAAIAEKHERRAARMSDPEFARCEADYRADVCRAAAQDGWEQVYGWGQDHGSWEASAQPSPAETDGRAR